jgi:demethylmenaquinone methyltransferase/2-methoxy-6-polyprenyl-1,4-benzoquinol methylase
MFGAISSTYDLLNRLLTAGLDAGWRRRAAALAAVGAPRRVLDLGTGTGDLALALLRVRGFDGQVVGVDFALPMLARARRKARTAPRPRFAQGDALALPFRAGAFDAAMAAFAVRNYADLESGLLEARRVLSAQGRLVVLEFFRPERLPWHLRFYLQRVLPRLGALVSGHGSAYRYLRDSQEGFVSVAECQAIAARCGFEVVATERLFPGVATAIVLGVAEPGRPRG